ADLAGISAESIRFEVDKTRRRLAAAAKKKQVKQALDPARTLQPAIASEHYEDLHSAMAEEGLLRMILTEPALFERANALEPEQFSSPLLGRAFEALRTRYQAGLSVTLATLEGSFTPEEIRHLTAIVRREETLVQDEAMEDYIRLIEEASSRRQMRSGGDLIAMRDRLKKIKGYGD
ncbi:MAG: DNA primase, partial [Clostridiales bacterium]|nr:DNA primase [Clostridiales bacterium]